MNLNMNENISIKNLTTFPVGFRRINGNGEVNLPPNTSVLIDRAEVISQIQSQNILFCGENNDSSHPYIFVEDKETRVFVGFETEDKPQEIISEDKIKKIFDIKTQKSFEKAITETIVTLAEKKTLIETIKKLGINDHSKIKFIEKYTEMKIDD
ncbi:MAG: hypothetical protein BWY47_00582 [Bacteroidetes bacterium ADurb.Bin302]|nr:MAG: hypothetical protein BWY47_00582 [Bacteroidetes bacterium ADurb.Bin302]